MNSEEEVARWLVWGMGTLYGLAMASCYFVSRTKNRRQWLWTLLGILGGVLTWIALSIAQPLQRCPHCAEGIRIDATTCKYCHKTVQLSEDGTNEPGSQNAVHG